MTITYELMREHGETLVCDSCASPAPLSEFAWGPPFSVQRQRPQRLLCQFCSTTMASRHTELPGSDEFSALRAEIWRAAGAVFNAMKHGLDS